MPRGPYRRYIRDSSIPVPPTTLWRRQQPLAEQVPVEHIEDEANSNLSAELEHSSNSFSSHGSDMHIEQANSDHEGEIQVQMDYQHGGSSSDRSALSESDEHVNNDQSSVADSNGTEGGSEHMSASDVQYMSDEDNFHDEEEINHNEDLHEEDLVNEPRTQLYPGSSITVGESRLLILMFAIRFNLSDEALEHLLTLINCHLPLDLYQSLFTYLKFLPKPPPVKTHYFCLNEGCERLVRFVDGSNTANCECGVTSNKAYLDRNYGFFHQIPLQEQLTDLLRNESLRSKLRWNVTNQSDVCSGKVYKKLVEQGVVGRRDLTLQWNTDGVQLFKSSSTQLWPIQVCINELPYQERRENIILCGLYYGRSKPNMNTFFQPIVEELNLLNLEGFEFDLPYPCVIKVHTILSPVDSMARAPLQNLKTFRGLKGCAFCLHPGEERAVGRGKARVYRGEVGPPRTYEQHRLDSLEVARTKKPKNGIKGPSVLLLLNNFHIINSFVPEYMHSVLLGQVKSMIVWWTAGKNSNEPFYLGSDTKIQEFDSILLSIKPPSEVTRTPRSLKDVKLWRASEFKHFLLYYSIVCLQHMKVPKKYIDHWFLLVYGISIMLKDKISDLELENATRALRKFVLSIEEVYGAPELCRYNTHLLLHIPRSCRDFGSLWAWSAFPYEHYNGILGKMFQSSQAVPSQICKSYLRLRALRDVYPRVINNPDCPPPIKEFYEKLRVCKKKSTNCFVYGEHLRLFGAPSVITLTLIQKVAIENLVQEEVCRYNVQSYERFIYKNTVFTVDSYQRLTKRQNHMVYLSNNILLRVTNIFKVVTLRSNTTYCVIIGKNQRILANEMLCKDRDLNIHSEAFSLVFEPTQEYVAIFPELLSRKCIVTPHPANERLQCCFPLANLVERD